MKKLMVLIAGMALCAVSPVMAQTQGEAGNTSTATMQVSANIVDNSTLGKVRITGIDNVIFGNIDKNATGSYTYVDQNICLWHSVPSFKLTVNRTSNPEAGSGLKIISQSGESINILVRITPDLGYTTGYLLQDGVALTGRTSTPSTVNNNDACNNLKFGTAGGNAMIQYFLNDANGKLPANVAVGNYTATFQYVMAAE